MGSDKDCITWVHNTHYVAIWETNRSAERDYELQCDNSEANRFNLDMDYRDMKIVTFFFLFTYGKFV